MFLQIIQWWKRQSQKRTNTPATDSYANVDFGTVTPFIDISNTSAHLANDTENFGGFNDGNFSGAGGGDSWSDSGSADGGGDGGGSDGGGGDGGGGGGGD